MDSVGCSVVALVPLTDELFESFSFFRFVHFALFFLMVFFVIQVLLMIREARDQQEHWDKIEEEIRHQRTLAANQSERDIVHALQRRPWYTLICTRIWSKHRTVLVQEEAAYKALRREFILDRGLDEPFAAKDEEKRVKETFNFGRYLGLAQVHILSHSVEVQSGTWMFFALGGVVFYFIAVLANENIEVRETVSILLCSLRSCFCLTPFLMLVDGYNSDSWLDLGGYRMALVFEQLCLCGPFDAFAQLVSSQFRCFRVERTCFARGQQ